VGNLMAKESATKRSSVNMGDNYEDVITDTPIEDKSNKENLKQRVIGSVMDPLGNIPVLKNAKFIKTFLANLEG
jgi:hypothetical protein